MLRRQAVRPLGPILAFLAVLMLALLAPLSPASAHDAVTGTNPEDGQNLETAPEAIDIVFTDTPLSLGSQIRVEDDQGENWAAGEVEIAGNTASQALQPDTPAGEYTVTWRVVSSDSHPIEGTFSFTAAEAAAEPSSTPSTPASSQSQTAATTTEPTTAPVTDAAAPASEAGTGFPIGFVIALGVLLLALAVVVVTVLARRSRTDGPGVQ
ncbi:copper resistance protein CopC [Citricoccus nitrophenolicus]|uniref:copper resistance CopC family protein n=1 Tax=Citricoccus nitrophenolicus TaxID=863575 RepID=UPI0039B4AA89